MANDLLVKYRRYDDPVPANKSGEMPARRRIADRIVHVLDRRLVHVKQPAGREGLG
jgi:hypothetical protein